MSRRIFWVGAALLILSLVGVAGEKELLGQAAEGLQGASGGSPNQQLCVKNASEALQKARDALEKGDAEAAKKKKREALRWTVQAVRECMEPGEIPAQIGEALRDEGAMSEKALGRFNDLMKTLVEAKKRKGGSGSPFCEGMAINQIMLALDELITGGWDGWHPEKAIGWYLNAAAECEDVQAIINQLLDYLNTHSDTTGIPDLGNEGCAKAKQMLDELYAKKRAGVPSEEIIELVDRIKAFLRKEGARTGKARLEKDRQESEQESQARPPPSTAPAPVTQVAFAALDGSTNISQAALGEIESVRFVATDGKPLKPKEVGANLDDHNGHLTLSIGKAAGLGSVLIAGTAGAIQMTGHGGGAAGPATAVSPADGMIEIRNGALQETLRVPPSATDMVGSPQEHAVMLNGQTLTPVAVRPGEVAVTASGITPPGSSLMSLDVTSPTGIAAKGIGAGWGYTVTMPEVTKTRAWVPVLAQVYGLDPQDEVTLVFYPQPGQEIDPRTVTVPAAELAVPSPVAKIRAARAGPQALNVTVTREE